MKSNKVEICGVNTSTLPLLSKEEKDELFIKIKAGNADDLFQIGCVGLIKAIDNFDLSQNVQFSTYAVPMIIRRSEKILKR